MEGCYHHGIVMPLKKKFEIMKEATCFVIPSSFSEQNSNYRYHSQAKLPELIASNRPIISYGQKTLLQTEYLKIKLECSLINAQ